MLKIVLGLIVALYVAVGHATVDVKKADAAELDGIKGIGPALSGKMLNERKKGAFKDWNDLILRVNGMGHKNAVKLSAAGLTVNDAAYQDGLTPPSTNAVKND